MSKRGLGGGAMSTQRASTLPAPANRFADLAGSGLLAPALQPSAIPVRRTFGWPEAEIELVVLVFDNPGGAKEALASLKLLKREKSIVALRNAAVLVKDEQGQTSLSELQDVDPKHGAIFGAITGGLVGLVGGPIGALVGAAAGAATGRAAAKRVDSGFSNKYLHDIQDKLQSGSSALVALVEQKWANNAAEALSQFIGGQLLVRLLYPGVPSGMLQKAVVSFACVLPLLLSGCSLFAGQNGFGGGYSLPLTVQLRHASTVAAGPVLPSPFADEGVPKAASATTGSPMGDEATEPVVSNEVATLVFRAIIRDENRNQLLHTCEIISIEIEVKNEGPGPAAAVEVVVSGSAALVEQIPDILPVGDIPSGDVKHARGVVYVVPETLDSGRRGGRR